MSTPEQPAAPQSESQRSGRRAFKRKFGSMEIVSGVIAAKKELTVLKSQLAEARKLAGTMSERHAKDETHMEAVVERLIEAEADNTRLHELITGLEAQVQVRGEMRDEAIQAMNRAEQDNARLRKAIREPLECAKAIHHNIDKDKWSCAKDPLWVPTIHAHATVIIEDLEAAFAGTPAPAASSTE